MERNRTEMIRQGIERNRTDLTRKGMELTGKAKESKRNAEIGADKEVNRHDKELNRLDMT